MLYLCTHVGRRSAAVGADLALGGAQQRAVKVGQHATFAHVAPLPHPLPPPIAPLVWFLRAVCVCL